MSDFLSPVSSPEKGILLIDKPYGWTSFQVVKKTKFHLQKKFNLKKIKVGHAGTLDPLATGLLIVCFGKETKNIHHYQSLKKEYSGSFFLGATTPCFDREKEIENTFDISHLTKEDIHQAAKTFIGKQQQVPPVFSAKKIAGKKAYDIARSGEDIELKANEIEVMSFEVTRLELPLVYFKIVCSKGTYIRSIARDFGKKLNTGAFLYDLRREKIGELEPKIMMTKEEVKNPIKPAFSVS